MNDKFRWSRQEVADLIMVTPARVSQIAKQLRFKPSWSRNKREHGYTAHELNKMRERNTKPGPKTGAKTK